MLAADVSSDPLLRTHRNELSAATALVVVHPNWWGKPPAILAGWIDRVLIPGVAYELPEGAGLPIPKLAVRSLLVVNTSDTPSDRENAAFGDPLQSIWQRCLPPYLGRPSFERMVLRPVAGSTPLQREEWLDEVGTATKKLYIQG